MEGFKRIGELSWEQSLPQVEFPTFPPEEVDDYPDYGESWPNSNTKLWRSAGRFPNDINLGFIGTPFKESLNVYLHIVPDEIRQVILDTIAPLVKTKHTAAQAIKYLSQVSGYYKRYPAADRMFVVDLATLFGTTPKFDDPDARLKDEVEKWVGERKTGPLTEVYLPIFRREAHNTITGMAREPPADLPLFDKSILRQRWIWGSSGSATNTPDWLRRRVKEQDEIYDNKWGLTLLLSDDELEDMALKSHESTPRAFAKPDEVVKFRAIISTDLPLHIKMSIVGKWLENVLNLDSVTDLYAGSGWMAKKVIEWDSLTEQGFLPLSLDESGFDQHELVEYIEAVLEAILTVIKRYARPGERDFLIQIMELIQKDIFPKFVEIGHTGVFVRYLNGVLSGWAWTALLDTLINIVQIRAVTKLGQNLNLDVYNVSPSAKGDDALLWTKNEQQAANIIGLYNAIGKEVNPKKFNWATSAEFLRNLYFPKARRSLFGYPARIVRALSFRHPGRRPPNPVERIEQTINNWKLFARRANGLLKLAGIKEKVAVKFAVDDVSRMTNVGRNKIFDWMEWIAALGGTWVDEGQTQGRKIVAKHIRNKSNSRGISLRSDWYRGKLETLFPPDTKIKGNVTFEKVVRPKLKYVVPITNFRGLKYKSEYFKGQNPNLAADVEAAFRSKHKKYGGEGSVRESVLNAARTVLTPQSYLQVKGVLHRLSVRLALDWLGGKLSFSAGTTDELNLDALGLGKRITDEVVGAFVGAGTVNWHLGVNEAKSIFLKRYVLRLKRMERDFVCVYT